MKGLYFYKLISPYQEDITKECKLTINEIDHNFVTLKNADIKDITFDEESGLLTLLQNNGDKFIAKIDLSHFTRDFNVEWDKENSALIFRYDDKEVIIDELVSTIVDNSITNIVQEIISQTITDDTLVGVGVGKDPLGINPLEMPGTYRAVECVINKMEGEYLPNEEQVVKGERFLSYEKLNLYGNLYNYDAVKKINEDLKNGWRVPTKEDWDNMLNAVELSDSHKNHGSHICGVSVGKYAGKFLKCDEYWEQYNGCLDCEDDEPILSKGIDAYGFCALPVGYSDEYGNVNYMGKQTKFWTMTETERTDVYTKCFFYDKTNLVQIAEVPNSFCSLRLVKDYDGKNFKGVETVNGVNYKTVLMPSENSKYGYAIWLASNVAFDNERYNPITLNQDDIVIDKTAYYINEWNGFQWMKKLLVDGDSLVIKVGPDGKDNHEYQLIDGKLVNIKLYVTNEIINHIDSTKTELQDNINTVLNKVTVLDDEVTVLGEVINEKEKVASVALNDLNEKNNALGLAINNIKTEFLNHTNDFNSTKTELRNNINTVSKKVTALGDEVNVLDEVINEKEKVTSVALNDLNEKNNALEHAINDTKTELQGNISANKCYFENTNTIDFDINERQDGIFVKSNVILQPTKIVNKTQYDNIILNDENGLFSYVNAHLEGNEMILNVNGNITKSVLPNCVKNCLYVKERNELVFKTQENDIVIPLHDVVVVSDNDNNIITKRNDGIYAKINISYNEFTNKLIIDNGIDVQEFILLSHQQDILNQQIVEDISQLGVLMDNKLRQVEENFNNTINDLNSTVKSNKNVFKDSETIKYNVVESNVGTNVESNVIISNNENNLLQKLSDGLFVTASTIQYDDINNNLIFDNGIEERTISLDNAKQNTINENINKSLKQQQLVSSSSLSILNDVVLLNEGTQLISQLKLSNDDKNIIKIKNDGVYAQVSLDYDKYENKLTFINSNGTNVYDLQSHTIVNGGKYDADTEEIVLDIVTAKEEEKTIRIPVGNLVSRINTYNFINGVDSPVTFTSEKVDVNQNITNVKAYLNILNHQDNLLHLYNDNGVSSLFVQSPTSTQIKVQWIENGEIEIKENTLQLVVDKLRENIYAYQVVNENLTEELNRTQERVVILENQIQELTEKATVLDDEVTVLDGAIKEKEKVVSVALNDLNEKNNALEHTINDIKTELQDNINTVLEYVKKLTNFGYLEDEE